MKIYSEIKRHKHLEHQESGGLKYRYIYSIGIWTASQVIIILTVYNKISLDIVNLFRYFIGFYWDWDLSRDWILFQEPVAQGFNDYYPV